ncbi:MAG: dTDP-4-dehydrorhamnose reductase [Candidatus Solibacter sp.]|nr:dTDP-4-dehydrorhamnose reductase [Candidatus Solibacter sp.]
MSPKIAILGAAGMLGHKMFQRLRAAFPGVVASMRKPAASPPFDRIELLQGYDVRSGMDATDFEALSSWLSEIRPDYIVNCIGVIKQRPIAQEAIPTITINALLPHRLAALAAGWNGRLIHFSTDCVFSGTRGAYTEEDESDAHDLYGRSKFLGEAAGGNALTLRTSIIGREIIGHRSLLDWFLSQKGHSVRGFRRVIYSGVTTNHLADLVADIIRNHSGLSGLYQAASSPISKYDLLCLLRDAYSLDVEITPEDTEQSDRSMIGQKLHRAIGYTAPSWRELLNQLATDRTPYESWISQ